jgi:hypothetical protein
MGIPKEILGLEISTYFLRLTNTKAWHRSLEVFREAEFGFVSEYS